MSKFVLRRKTFGIREGRPDRVGSAGREFWEKFKGLGGHAVVPIVAGSGAVLGAVSPEGSAGNAARGAAWFGGLALAVTAIPAALSLLGADARRSRASRSNMSQILHTLFNNYQPKTDYVGYTGSTGVSYNTALVTGDANISRIIKEDQDPDKFKVTFAYEDGKGVIFLNKPDNSTIYIMDHLLDDLIKEERRTNYVSEKLEDGSYIVLLDCPSIDGYGNLIYRSGVELGKVNCLTDKKLRY